MKPAYPPSTPRAGNENDMWSPAIGDTVWLNYPDSEKPMGKVVGFVPDDAERRIGQPIIEQPDGKRVVTHPMFLLPFQCGGPEWQQAAAEGRIR